MITATIRKATGMPQAIDGAQPIEDLLLTTCSALSFFAHAPQLDHLPPGNCGMRFLNLNSCAGRVLKLGKRRRRADRFGIVPTAA